MTMDDDARDENNTQDCGCCGLQAENVIVCLVGIECVLGEICCVIPCHGRHTGPTVIIKTVRAELASGARQCHTNTVAECCTV